MHRLLHIAQVVTFSTDCYILQRLLKFCFDNGWGTYIKAASRTMVPLPTNGSMSVMPACMRLIAIMAEATLGLRDASRIKAPCKRLDKTALQFDLTVLAKWARGVGSGWGGWLRVAV